ncbi:hypothetical protein CBL_00693 [Carabus blaptoides fortunei]
MLLNIQYFSVAHSKLYHSLCESVTRFDPIINHGFFHRLRPPKKLQLYRSKPSENPQQTALTSSIKEKVVSFDAWGSFTFTQAHVRAYTDLYCVLLLVQHVPLPSTVVSDLIT